MNPLPASAIVPSTGTSLESARRAVPTNTGERHSIFPISSTMIAAVPGLGSSASAHTAFRAATSTV